MSSLYDLFDSTEKFLRRFHPFLPALYSQLVAHDEEVKEFRQAVIEGTADEATKEFVDVMVTGMGLLAIRGVTPEELTDCIYYTIAKNDSKTKETHYVAEDGKIDRIGRVR